MPTYNDIVLDFETASFCDLKKSGSWRYAEDATTEVLCLSYAIGFAVPRTWFPGDPIPADLREALAAKQLAVAHNTAFEKAIWRNIMEPVYGWPPIPDEQWHDTLAVCAMRNLPLALERAGQVLGLTHQKDMEGNKLTLSLSRPNKAGFLPVRTPAVLARVGQYCEGDVLEQRDLHTRIGYLPPAERPIWLHTERVNERGVKLDLPLIAAMQDVVTRASGPLAAEFADLTGGLKFTQIAKVKDWVLDQGVELPNLAKDTLAELLGDDDAEGDVDLAEIELPENVERALRIRQLVGSASVKKLGKMLQCVGNDGRARGLLQYHGTGPGRNSGRLLQPQNFPRGTNELITTPVQAKVDAIMSRDLKYIEMLLGPAVEAVVGSLRHTLVAEQGHEYVAGDFAGIQARVVLALAGEHEKTALMAAGADIYCDMASEIYERPITKKDTAERQTGKNSVLGLGFQMGAPKFQLKYAKDQPIEFVEKVVRTYREKWAPGVPDVWRALGDAALDTVRQGTPHEAYGVRYALEDRWLTCRLPSGRKMWYFNPKLIRKLMPWSTLDNPDVRLAVQYQAMKGGRWVDIDIFGGQLTENVVMGIERDIMTDAADRCEANGFPVVLDVHDELVTEPLTRDNSAATLKEIMQDVAPWVKELRVPIAVDAWAGERYKK